jgi:subtilisin family serine protease
VAGQVARQQPALTREERTCSNRAASVPPHSVSRAHSVGLGLSFAVISALTCGAAGAVVGGLAPEQVTTAVPGEVIVAFGEAVSEQGRDRVLAEAGAVEVEQIEEIDAELVESPSGEMKATIKKLEADPRVEYAEPNFIVSAAALPPDDAGFAELWGLHNEGQAVNGVVGVPDADLDALEAWSITTGSAAVVVGVIDSGVDFGHPDLGGGAESSAVMWVNPGEDCSGCRTDQIDNDLNGYVDDWRGWDFVNDDNDPSDDNGHGTHVGGTIGAIGNNGVGITGVNWTVKILALKFLDAAGSGTTANAIKAVLYAADMGIPITSNSWGGGQFSQALLDAIREADARGSLFAAAAGNGARNNDSTKHYPSSYDVPNVIAVAATDAADERASFSNYGRSTVDLGAPGVNIYSTWLDGAYRHASGTSMATAHVAGAAALVRAAAPESSHLGVKALLLGTVDTSVSLDPGGASPTASGGRLNVDRAVRCEAAPVVWLDAPAPGFLTSVGEPVEVSAIAVSCANPAGVTVTAAGNGSEIALTPRGDGLYTGTYVPESSGALTITVSGSVGTASTARTAEGLAVTNYRLEDAPFEWIDATLDGTNAGMACDDCWLELALPFEFDVYQQPFSSVRVSSNGYLVFGSSPATAYSNVAIPSPSDPNGIVAPFWDDLNLSGGAIWYTTIGTAPTRRFVIAWVGVPRFPQVGAATFEVVLEESTNDIIFQYQDVQFGQGTYDFGASATVGVENLNGTIGRQFSHAEARLQPYENAKALKFVLR